MPSETRPPKVGKWTEPALRVLRERYLSRKRDNGLETPEEMCWRVALAIALGEARYGRSEAAVKEIATAFYEMMVEGYFLPNSPTLMNAGKDNGLQYSACYVLPVGDSMDEIFDSVKAAAIIHKSGGGTGFAFSRLRPKDDVVASTGGRASGPVSFLRVFNSATEAVKQGGCVTADTRVSTDRGLVEIRALGPTGAAPDTWHEPDRLLRVATDEGPRASDGFYVHGVAPVRRLRTRHGYRVSATLEHRFRVITDDGQYAWKALEDIQVGDWVALQKRTYLPVDDFRFPAVELPSDPSGPPVRLPETPTGELGEFIGYLLGAGAVSGQGPAAGRLRLTVRPGEADVACRLLEIADRLFGLPPVRPARAGDGAREYCFDSTALVAWLAALGVEPSPAPDARLPELAFRAGPDFARGLMRGLYTATGTVSTSGAPCLSSVSQALVEGVQDLLLALGVPSSPALAGERRRPLGSPPVYRLRVLTGAGLGVFADEIGFFSAAQQSRLRAGLDKAREGREGSAGPGARLPREDQFYDQVEKIEEGEALTLDLSVPANNTYVANGFVSHNTRRGANMGILQVDHPDILEFIECKLDGGITNFNISVAATDQFMDALAKGADYGLINPRTKTVVGRLSAREVFDRIVRAAWRTGDPGMVFIDRINASPANPTPEVGAIEATNPCGEQPLLPNEACFAPETRITTDRGLEGVAELYLRQQRGEPVSVATNLNGLGMPIVVRPATVAKVGVKPTVRVTLTNGQALRVTPDHRLLTDRGWKEAGALDRGDRVRIQTGVAAPLRTTRTPGELGGLDGWLTGDGWFTPVVGPTVVPDEDLALAGAGQSGRQVTGGRVKVQAQTAKGALTAAGGAPRALGLRPAPELRTRVPKALFTAPREDQRRYLEALFGAGGSPVTVSSASVEWLRDIQLLLLNLGLRSTIQVSPSRAGEPAWGVLTVTGGSDHRFGDLVGFALASHAEPLGDQRAWLGTREDHPAVPVASVEAAEAVEVYDVSEPVTHSLIAEGMIVHNCNLGSLNVAKFVRQGADGESAIDWDEMERVVRLGVRFLDDVIEMNPYPLPVIDATVKANRRIGLGVMGWADLLFTLGLPYDSDQAIDLATRLMAFIKDKAHDQSARLAEERGPFPNWSRSIYKSVRPMRNSTVTTIAPTGTISMIAGCSSGIEPIFALAFEHRVKQGDDGERVLTFVNETFEAIARREGFYSEALMQEIARRGTLHGIPGLPAKAEQVFKTAHEIAYEWHVRHQAAFQRFTDNGVSKTINLPNSASEEDVASAYRLAWELGCLGITVFRDGCKGEQVLNIGVSPKDKPSLAAPAGPAVIKPRPHSLTGTTYRMETPIGTAFITVNETPDGEPFEVFVQVGKGGSDTMAVAEALGRLVSLVLRLPSPLSAQRRLEEIISQLARIGGGQPTGFGPSKVLSLPDALARTLAEHIGQIKPAQARSGLAGPAAKRIGDLCKECGQATFIYEEGCKKCLSCGFNEC